MDEIEKNNQIVVTASRQLSWSHFVEILPLKDDLQREFYLTFAASERWSVRQLRKEIDGMLFERTAISGKSDEFIKKELSTLRDDNVMSPKKSGTVLMIHKKLWYLCTESTR